jgi:hypothetical protein
VTPHHHHTGQIDRAALWARSVAHTAPHARLDGVDQGPALGRVQYRTRTDEDHDPDASRAFGSCRTRMDRSGLRSGRG